MENNKQKMETIRQAFHPPLPYTFITKSNHLYLRLLLLWVVCMRPCEGRFFWWLSTASVTLIWPLQAQLVLYCHWTLDMHWLNQEDAAYVVGGRTIMCELGCPFSICLAYFHASPVFIFSAAFILSHLEKKNETISLMLRVKLLSPHPSNGFAL